jgi:20S proteasome alpha/beta subunit
VKSECVPSGIIVPNLFLRIFKLHKTMGLTYTGIQPDCFMVLNEAKKLVAEMERTGEIDVERLASELVLFMQPFGQRKDFRPLAVAMILGGLDPDGDPRLFYLSSPGITQECNTYAEGVGSEKAEKILEEEYNENLSLKEAAILATRAVLTERKLAENILLATIDKKGVFKELGDQERQSLIKAAFH